MTGVVIPETFLRTPILSARKIHKQSSARISLYVLMSKGCAVKPSAFQNLLRCMILSLVLLSIFGSSGLFIPRTTGAVHDLKRDTCALPLPHSMRQDGACSEISPAKIIKTEKENVFSNSSQTTAVPFLPVRIITGI